MKLLSVAKKLNKREKYAVYGAAGIICLLLLHYVLIAPLTDARGRLDRKLTAKIRINEDMIALRSEYRAIDKRTQASASRFSDRKAGFTLFAFLDQLAGEAEMKDFITYMKPSTTSPKDSPYKIAKVEMRFQDVTLSQLSTYLFKVETSQNLAWVKRLSISKDSKQPGFVNAILQVETSEI